MTKYKIVKESKALPMMWEVGRELETEVQSNLCWYERPNKAITQEHVNALLELGVVEEVKECNDIESVTLNGVEIQQNGIIRNSKGRLIGRLDGIEYASEHVQRG